MKEKMKITEENYKEVVLKRSIIVCWILLAICFVIKIFGGNFFEIVCTNKNFIKVCELVDKTFIVYLLQFVVFITSSLFVFKCIDCRCNNKNTIIKLSIYSLVWIIKHLQSIGIININIYLIDLIDFGLIYLLSVLFYSKKDKIKFIKPAIMLLLLFVFTMISAVTKNIGLNGVLSNYSLVSLIFMVDYYIMIVLTYFYEKRRCK